MQTKSSSTDLDNKLLLTTAFIHTIMQSIKRMFYIFYLFSNWQSVISFLVVLRFTGHFVRDAIDSALLCDAFSVRIVTHVFPRCYMKTCFCRNTSVKLSGFVQRSVQGKSAQYREGFIVVWLKLNRHPSYMKALRISVCIHSIYNDCTPDSFSNVV